MDIDTFENEMEAELNKYNEIYKEYNKTLEKTLSLVDEIRSKFKKNNMKII